MKQIWTLLLSSATILCIVASAIRSSSTPTKLKAEWVSIPGGQFQYSQGMSHRVETFLLWNAEVTNEEYQHFLDDCPENSNCGPGRRPSNWEDKGLIPRNPVVFVTFEDAERYCAWFKSRLPSAEEWKYAAQGPDRLDYPAGTDAGTTHPFNIIGPDHSEMRNSGSQTGLWAIDDPRYQNDKSGFGIFGMSGNASEWTSTRSETNSQLMIVAGGNWDSWSYTEGKSDFHSLKQPNEMSSSIGIRCAKDPP